MATFDVMAKLRMDATEFVRGLKSGEKATQEFASTAKQMSKGVSNELALASSAMLVGVGLMVRNATKAAEEAIKVGRETSRVLETTGASAWTTSDQVGDLADALSRVSGADDELIQSGANLLLTFTQIQNRVGEGNDIFNQATQAALDMSVVLGNSMSGSAIQLGKALNNPIKGMTALSRAGVSFTEEQKEQVKTFVETGNVLDAQKVILAELQKEFGGAAAAAATPLDHLRVSVGNLQETLGLILMPIITRVADAIRVMAEAFMALPGPVQDAVTIIGGIGIAGFGAIGVIGKLTDIFRDVLGPVLGGLRKFIDNAAIGFGILTERLTGSANMGTKVASSLAGAVTPALLGITVAVTAAFAVWAIYQQNQAEAEQRAKEFTDTLDKQSGALTANTQAMIEKTFEDRNQVDNLNKARISFAQYTNAIQQNGQAIALTRNQAEALANLPSGAPARDQLIQQLKDEGGARSLLIAQLAEQGALDQGIVATIYEQIDAYDKQQVAIANAATQQAMKNGMDEYSAIVAGRAASANKMHADSVKELADEIRAQTDPYFAAYRSQQQLNDAVTTYALTAMDTARSEKDRRDAYINAAQASLRYKTDLLALDGAQKANGATIDQFQQHLDDMKKHGLDPTAQAAKDATKEFTNLAFAAAVTGQQSVEIPVKLDFSDPIYRLRWLREQADTLGRIPLEAIWQLGAYAKGGTVANGMFVVGENGPELGMKQGSSVRIFSNPESRRMLSSGGGSNVTYAINVNVAATADKAAVGQSVVEAIAAYERRNGTGWRS